MCYQPDMAFSSEAVCFVSLKQLWMHQTITCCVHTLAELPSKDNVFCRSRTFAFTRETLLWSLENVFNAKICIDRMLMWCMCEGGLTVTVCCKLTWTNQINQPQKREQQASEDLEILVNISQLNPDKSSSSGAADWSDPPVVQQRSNLAGVNM